MGRDRGESSEQWGFEICNVFFLLNDEENRIQISKINVSGRASDWVSREFLSHQYKLPVGLLSTHFTKRELPVIVVLMGWLLFAKKKYPEQ